MKLYEAKYGYKSPCREDYRYWGMEYFLLEDDDDPIEIIGKHYNYMSNNELYSYKLMDTPALITKRSIIMVEAIDPITENGKYDE